MTIALPRLIAEVERLTDELHAKVSENVRIRQEVAKVMVALDKGEMKISMDLMNEFYRILGIEPPYASGPV